MTTRVSHNFRRKKFFRQKELALNLCRVFVVFLKIFTIIYKKNLCQEQLPQSSLFLLEEMDISIPTIFVSSGDVPRNEFSLYKNNPQLFNLKFWCPWFLCNSVYWVIAFLLLSVPYFIAGMFVLVTADSLHIDSTSDVDGLLISVCNTS